LFGYDKILRVAGRSFRNFLYSIDQLHESNRFSFPKMQHPLFFVEKEDSTGVFLHYKFYFKILFLIISLFKLFLSRSKRKGFNSYVIGQLKACSKKFFNKDIRVKLVKDYSNNECKLVYNQKILNF
jgi:guanylate cyclase